MAEYFIQIVVGTPAAPQGEFTAVADAFFDLESVSDHDVAADANRITFSMSIVAADEVSALSTAMVAVRTSIHAAGGATPGWESDIATLRTVIEREDSRETV